MIEKSIVVDGKEVRFRASAALPREYRLLYGRDIFRDLTELTNEMNDGEMSIPNLEIFEDLAFLMARSADPTITPDIMEWLDGFETFSIYEVLPEIIALWSANTQTAVTPKKKQGRRRAK